MSVGFSWILNKSCGGTQKTSPWLRECREINSSF